MNTKLAALIVTVSVIAFGAASSDAAAQPSIPPLPADLLFTTNLTEAWGVLPRNVIARVDAETLEVSPFYVDAEGYELMPLSWSPQGDLLAVYRRMPPLDEAYTLFPRQLCILTRDGVLQTCMADHPPMHWGGLPQSWQYYFPVAWGPDGQTIYFSTEYSNESTFGYGRRLVEASVVTGETLRVVYDYPDPYPITPSPDLNHVTVGFGGNWQGPGAPAFLVDLTAGQQIDIPSVVPDDTTLFSTCWSFSPNGNYIVVIVVYELAAYAPEQDPTLNNGSGSLLLILDMQGTIQGIIGQPDGENTLWFQDCPGWQPDEQAIVFWASDSEKAYIMRYSLPDQQLTTLSELKPWPELGSTVNTPLIPTSDGRYVALTVSDPSSGVRQVAVLCPDGEIYRIPSPYRFGLYPLWVPPLISDPGPE